MHPEQSEFWHPEHVSSAVHDQRGLAVVAKSFFETAH